MEATFLAIPGAPHPPSSAGDGTRITVNSPARCKRASRRQSRLSVLTLSPADFGINDGAIIDLFIDRWDPLEFSRAVDTVVEAYRREGLDVILARRPRRWRGWKPPSQRTAGRGRWTWPQTSEAKTGGALDWPGPRRSRRGSEQSSHGLQPWLRP